MKVTGGIAVKTHNKSTDSKGRTCLTLLKESVTYLDPLQLAFRLPCGDITEGPLTSGAVPESMLSGTLRFEEKPVEGARICLFRETIRTGYMPHDECVRWVCPDGTRGIYRTEIRTARGELYRSSIDVPVPCDYRNRIGIDENQQVPHPGKGRP